MEQKEQRTDQDRDDQKSGRPVQLDKDKQGQHQDDKQHQQGQQHQQGNQPRPADRPTPQQPVK